MSDENHKVRSPGLPSLHFFHSYSLPISCFLKVPSLHAYCLKYQEDLVVKFISLRTEKLPVSTLSCPSLSCNSKYHGLARSNGLSQRTEGRCGHGSQRPLRSCASSQGFLVETLQLCQDLLLQGIWCFCSPCIFMLFSKPGNGLSSDGME